MINKQNRRLRRFFSSHPIEEVGKSVFLPETETHHLKNILRYQPGDRCLITDGLGAEAEILIKAFTADGRTQGVVEKVNRSQKPASRLSLNIHIALLQRGKIDEIIEKLQELGIEKIFPIMTERTVVKMTPKKDEVVLQRWRKIAQEAAKQSGQLQLMEIAFPETMVRSITALPNNEMAALFHPGDSALPFPAFTDLLEEKMEKQGKYSLHLFFGPEGGFTEKEVESIRQRNESLIVQLGSGILKSDTVCIGACAALKFLFP